MKEKNAQNSKKKSKWTLVGVASVLAVIVSVGITYAYLTATTDPKVNTFTAAGNIRGKVMEPKFNTNVTHYCEPGITEVKDPLVQNLTTGEEIIVGARLKFEICVNGTTYTQVTKSVFEEYVDVAWNTVALASTTGSSKAWALITADTSGTTPYAYFIYDGVLSSYNTDAVTPTATSPTAADYDSGGDNTRPIFVSVTPKAGITINADSTTTALPTSDYLDTTYKKFNYRITIDSYGVNASSVTGTTAAAKITALKANSDTGDTMLAKLKSMS